MTDGSSSEGLVDAGADWWALRRGRLWPGNTPGPPSPLMLSFPPTPFPTRRPLSLLSSLLPRSGLRERVVVTAAVGHDSTAAASVSPLSGIRPLVPHRWRAERGTAPRHRYFRYPPPANIREPRRADHADAAEPIMPARSPSAVTAIRRSGPPVNVG